MCVHANVLIHAHVIATTVHLVALAMFTYCVHVNVTTAQELLVHVTTTHIVNVMYDTVQVVAVQRFAVATAQLVDVLHMLHIRVPLMVHLNRRRGHAVAIAIIPHDFFNNA